MLHRQVTSTSLRWILAEAHAFRHFSSLDVDPHNFEVSHISIVMVLAASKPVFAFASKTALEVANLRPVIKLYGYCLSDKYRSAACMTLSESGLYLLPSCFHTSK